MGTGADDMVASAHAMSIGVGEIIGPMVGGYFVELLPTSQVRCHVFGVADVVDVVDGSFGAPGRTEQSRGTSG